jgi:LacI family transcriptional regulator
VLPAIVKKDWAELNLLCRLKSTEVKRFIGTFLQALKLARLGMKYSLRMATRLKDIANDLGLSVVTISKVLRDHPDIAAETRRRVLKRMRELNYQPNIAARSLVTGRTWTLGLVVPDLLHPFFAHIAKAISVEARKQGYSLLISSSDEDPELEVQEIKQLLARRVDVILVASAQW